MVGLGEAWSTSSRGPTRFADVSRAWGALLEGALIDASGSPRGTGPLLLGGFAFLDEPAESPAWAAFDPASLVLPSLLLTITGDSAWLTLAVVAQPGSPADADVERLLSSWATVADGDEDAESVTAPTRLRAMESPGEASRWRDSVARLAGAVGRGRLDKAVLSRCLQLQGSGPIEVTSALRNLGASAPESTIFAVTRGAATFMGASPERLAALRDRELDTMAMAGSARRAGDRVSDDALASRLLASDKEREEHAVVVTMLREALSPLVEELRMPPGPTVERFRHVQHLVTPIHGRLRDEADILALVERLHPTPAVAGTPRDLALELIAEEEPEDRGWYAGPLGWVDRHGDGEFIVALRSGLVDGDTATLFAGCGIMADSDPEREWDESASKLLALGSALGRLEP